MPQITVNEIDQSVVTRVVSDDKVKILIPAILSFGPGYDSENGSVMTFTDVSDFNRGCGYTSAEFNPFKDDYSRTYAMELMKRGSAVSVVRVNNAGQIADFNIDGSGVNSELPDRSTPTAATICPAAIKGIPANALRPVKTSENPEVLPIPTVTGGTSSGTSSLTPTGQTSGQYIIIPGTITLTLQDDEDNLEYTDAFFPPVYTYDDDQKTNKYEGVIVAKKPSGDYAVFGKVNYYTGVITGIQKISEDPDTYPTIKTIDYKYYAGGDGAWKHTFCPQIESITAKYSGSFGNNLFISIAQINTSRLTESYQYANISVYYIDRNINYKYDSVTGVSEIVSQTVNNVTMLETKRVSTNPNDPNYFEDVEFDFIRINAKATAREELSLVWSNISGRPESEQQYSGFPVIPLRYNLPNGLSSYNFESNFNKHFGTDFNYTPDMVQKLKAGFKGFDASTESTGNWSQKDVNEYLEQVYQGVDGGAAIRDVIIENLTSLYEDYTDPYIYDFDFITSGGFVYEKYELITQLLFTTEKLESNSDKLSHRIYNIPENGVTVVKGDDTLEGVTVTKSDNTYTISYVPESESVTIATITNGDEPTVVISLSGAKLTVNYQYENTVTVGGVSVPVKVADRVYPGTSGEYTTITPIHASMLNLVETRQDCIALFDVPRYYDRTVGLIEYSRMLDTSYGTMHFPWCWVSDPNVSGNMLLMAPSYIFLYTFLSNLDNNVDSQKWFPPAGVKRATARVVKKPDFEIGSTLLNIWQNDNTARVNPIMKLKQYGYVIYGQYTCLPAIDMFTHSALESLNVRLIANVVKKKIFDVCLNLAFEPNTSTLWLKFFSQMDEFLRYMQYNEGVYAYKIVMDESTVTTDDINHLRCPGKVYIAPTRTAEFFDIDFIITEAGALFNS